MGRRSHTIAQANIELGSQGEIVEDLVNARGKATSCW